VAIQPNHIITKVIMIPMIQENTKKEKKGNIKVVPQITNGEEDEEDGRNEKAQKNQIPKMKINVAMILRTAQYEWMRLKNVIRRSARATTALLMSQ